MHYSPLQFVTVLLTALCFACPSALLGQENPPQDTGKQSPVLGDMELIDRVDMLRQQLESPSIPQRDEAQKELLELGIRVLDHLDPAEPTAASDVIQRISKVRTELEKIVAKVATQSSRATISGKMTVGEALAALKKQTKNDVALTESTSDIFRNRTVDLKIENGTFWTALNSIAQQGGIMVAPYAANAGQIRLVPTQFAMQQAVDPKANDAGLTPNLPPQCISGIFEVSVTQVIASRNLVNPQLNYCNISTVVRWEPRITPISIQLPAASVKATDDQNQPINITNSQAVFYGTVQSEIAEIEFFIPIELTDRTTKKIKTLTGTGEAVIAGRVETFRFKKLGRLKDGYQQTRAGATVTYQGMEKNEQLFGVAIKLGFDAQQNALESYHSWVYDNKIYLEDEKGIQTVPIAYDGIGQTKNEITVRYYFDTDPSAMNLVYQTPASIVKVPIKIELTEIPLP
jgi:hypothetical protein